jgi:RNA polymerase sigma factor (sigma-70 family)
MTTTRLSKVIHHLRRAVLLRDGAGLSDPQLLECFLSRREEAAFAALVRRHGPMVLGVCRRVLRHRQDAEDAFQAAFLVLARRAASIASRELLASWLYGVAYRTALKARAAATRRRGRERQVSAMPEPAAARPDPWEDVRPLLDEELSRLPDQYRLPIILCDLEGKTHKEAAGQLGWPVGTLSGRLARARHKLAGRLARHGFTLAGPTLAAGLAERAAAEWVPASLVSATVRAAGLGAAGPAAAAVSAPVASLVEGVLHSMLPAQAKLMTALLVGILALATGTGGVAALCGHDGGAAPPTTAAAADIGQHIQKLGSARFAEREAATQALDRIGEPALDALYRAAAQGADLETRRRAERLIHLIERRWELRCFTGHPDAVPKATLSRDGRLVLSAGRSEPSPRIWDLATGQELRRGAGHDSWVWDVAFLPDGKRALSAGVDGLRLWEVATGKLLQRFTGHERQVYRLAVSADGRQALSGSQDTTVRLWDVTTGRELRRFAGHTEDVSCVAFSPDGCLALSGCTDDQLRLWDVASGRELRRLAGGRVGVFSPDGRRVLSAGPDRLLRLWDVTTGRELRRFAGHTDAICCVAFSADGRRALSGGDDNTVRLWDVATGRQLRCLRGHADVISSVTFTPDGRRALSASYDRTLRLWALPK